MKEFKKDEEEIKMEEIMEEEHVKFTNKAKWTRPKPKINRQATQYVKLGEIEWSGLGSNLIPDHSTLESNWNQRAALSIKTFLGWDRFEAFGKTKMMNMMNLNIMIMHHFRRHQYI